MKYMFFVNIQQDEAGRPLGFFGYRQGHALELGYESEIDATSEAEARDRLFEKFNIAHPSDYRNRSMSVGDVIVFDGNRAYACESAGWKEVPRPVEAEVARLKTINRSLLKALRQARGYVSPTTRPAPDELYNQIDDAITQAELYG